MKVKFKYIAFVLSLFAFTLTVFSAEPLQKTRITFKAKEGATLTAITNTSGLFLLDMNNPANKADIIFDKIEVSTKNSVFKAENISLKKEINKESNIGSNKPLFNANDKTEIRFYLCDKSNGADCDNSNSDKVLIKLSLKDNKIIGNAYLEKPSVMQEVSSK